MIWYFVGPVFSKETNHLNELVRGYIYNWYILKWIALYLIDKNDLLAKFIKIQDTDQQITVMA